MFITSSSLSSIRGRALRRGRGDISECEGVEREREAPSITVTHLSMAVVGRFSSTHRRSSSCKLNITSRVTIKSNSALYIDCSQLVLRQEEGSRHLDSLTSS